MTFRYAAVRFMRRPWARQWRTPLPAALLVLTLHCPDAVASPERVAARAAFLAAEQALRAGDRPTFDRLSATLRDDPLSPYLQFAALNQDLTAAPDAAIEEFLAHYPDTPLAGRLRQAYLRRLAAAERWLVYLRYRHPDDPLDLRCLAVRAQLETGQAAAALEQVEPLWLRATALPAVCDPVIRAWQAAGQLTPDRVWRRIRLAMAAGEIQLAQSLGELLPAAERGWHARWLAVDRDPDLVTDPARWAADAAHPQQAAILAHGLARLAPQSPARAAAALTLWHETLATDPESADRARAAVGAALTEAGDPAGLRIWDGLRATPDNLAEQERRLRAAIAHEAWDWLADWIARMPDSTEKRDRWLYWQGRAEAALGRTTAAFASLNAAARQRSFWGFMAADRLGRPYALDHAPIAVDPAQLQALVECRAFLRLAELRQLGRETDARREWRMLVQELEPAALPAAAVLAALLGWHDQAIATLARADDWGDLVLRFPLAHLDLITRRARDTALPVDWVLALIRQESLFAPDAISGSGAVGLMQLMPATARELATGLGLPPPDTNELVQPALNIALGTRYLARMHDRFGHPALATAAYNAGPRRVAQWLPERTLEADLWIARIPFRETRGYVERVMAYRIIYAARLGRDPPRLDALLPPVPGAERSDTARASQASQPRAEGS